MDQSGALYQKYLEVRKSTAQLPCRIEVLDVLAFLFWPHQVNSTNLHKYELTRRSGGPLIIKYDLTEYFKFSRYPESYYPVA